MKQKKENKERLSGDERKAQIINAALDLFAEKGFNGTRTREIADSVGISETLIFQHFKTKDDLIREALGVLFHPHPVSGELAKTLKKTTDDEEFLRIITMHLIHHNRQDPRIMKLAIYCSIEGGHFGELTHTNEATGPSMLTILSEYIYKRIENGVFIEVNAELAARLFVEMVYMYIADRMAAITGPEIQFGDDEVVETMVNIFLRGLRK